jgi:hypothetical protein
VERCCGQPREAAIDRSIVEGYTRVPDDDEFDGLSEITLSTDDGMPADCVLNFDNLAILNKSWFVEPICQLSPVRMVQACRALAVAMGC